MPTLDQWDREWLTHPQRYAAWSPSDREIYAYLWVKYFTDLAVADAILGQKTLAASLHETGEGTQ